MTKPLARISDALKGLELGVLYLLVFALLTFGVVNYSGTTYASNLALVIVPFLVFFGVLRLVVFRRAVKLRDRITISYRMRNVLLFGLVAMVFLTMVAHFLYMGNLPIILQWRETDIIDAALVRQEITEGIPGILGYSMSFTVKAMLPFLLIFTWHSKRKKLFIITLAIGLFYLLNLLQKSYMVLFLLPFVIYTLFQRKYLVAGITVAGMMALIFFLVYASNPALRGHAQKDRPDMSGLEQSSRGLLDRTLYLPGRVVTVWFDNIPSEYPYQQGCGYNFIAPIKGCQFRDYAKDMYQKIYPQYAAMGLKGSANGASFVYEYANFGKPGLVLSGFMLATVFFMVQVVFAGSRKFLMSLNAFPVLMLSSVSLTTLSLSGGWGLILVLFLIFRKELT
jgi:hypothetical protein